MSASNPFSSLKLRAKLLSNLAEIDYLKMTLVALLLAATSASADTEIYRCTLNDGTMGFQEIPCAEPADETAEDEAQPIAEPDFVNPFDEPEALPEQAEPSLPARASQDRSECEKTTRDAIDVIDLEMRSTSYTQEEGQAYMAELRTLTQQLRACKLL